MKENITSNLTNKESTTAMFIELPSRHVALIAFETSTAFLINITALLGNVLVCYTVYRNSRLRTIANYSVVSLAISDLLFATLCLPFSLEVLIQGKWIYGNFICTLQAYLANCLASVSILTITLTAVNRYSKIVRSTAFYRSYFTKRKTLAVTFIIWLVVFCTMIVPLVTGWANAGFHPAKASCILFYKSEPTSLAAMVTIMVIFLCIPWVITVVCYARVFFAIRRHKTRIAALSDSPRLGPSVEDINITRTLFVVLLGFSVCWIPIFVITGVHLFGIGESSRFLHMTYSILGALSCAINPLIYGIMNRAFRREYRKIFMVCRSNPHH